MSNQLNLSEEVILKVAEEMRLRHYRKQIGHEPYIPFSELYGHRKEKWLDEVKNAAELLAPYFNASV